jgi:hypothetical protein
VIDVFIIIIIIIIIIIVVVVVVTVRIKLKLTNYAKSSSSSHEISHILWKPKGLLPFSLQPATCCIREPHQPSPRSTILFKFHFNIILLSMPSPPNGLLSSRFPTKHQKAFLFSPHTCQIDLPTPTSFSLI